MLIISFINYLAKRKTAAIRRPLAADVHERRKEMPQIVLPDALRRILIDDENLINKSCFLPKLPARITAFDIVQKVFFILLLNYTFFSIVKL